MNARWFYLLLDSKGLTSISLSPVILSRWYQVIGRRGFTGFGRHKLDFDDGWCQYGRVFIGMQGVWLVGYVPLVHSFILTVVFATFLMKLVLTHFVEFLL